MVYRYLIILFFVISSSVYSLPFNDDMVNSEQVVDGESFRANPENTEKLNQSKIDKTYEDAESITNPVISDNLSLKRGQRNFRVNCYPCHGQIKKDDYKNGPIENFSYAPNLALDFYKSYSDGKMFSTVKHGVRTMPALGWKFEDKEIWDIVNYIRMIQGE